MQSDNDKSMDLLEKIECRFLNSDGAGVVLERLSQHQLVELSCWFSAAEGCRGGSLLLDIAPILDTSIEIQARLLPSPEDFEQKIRVDDEGEDGTDAGAPVHGDMDGEPLPDPGQPKWDSPQVRCYGLFGCGLIWGVRYLEDAAGGGSSPFAVERDIADFLLHVSREEADFLPRGKWEAKGKRSISPAFLALRLMKKIPSLDLVLHSAYRLAINSQTGPWGGGGGETHLRYLFFLGLLAAGLRIPAPPAPQDEAASTEEVLPRGQEGSVE